MYGRGGEDIVTSSKHTRPTRKLKPSSRLLKERQSTLVSFIVVPSFSVRFVHLRAASYASHLIYDFAVSLPSTIHTLAPKLVLRLNSILKSRKLAKATSHGCLFITCARFVTRFRECKYARKKNSSNLRCTLIDDNNNLWRDIYNSNDDI